MPGREDVAQRGSHGSCRAGCVCRGREEGSCQDKREYGLGNVARKRDSRPASAIGCTYVCHAGVAHANVKGALAAHVLAYQLCREKGPADVAYREQATTIPIPGITVSLPMT